MHPSHLGQHPDIGRFIQDLDKARVSCIEKKRPKSHEFQRFVPGSEIDRLLSGEHNVDSLLRAIFPEASPAVSATDVLSCCPKVFCILLEIGQGHWIENFVHNSDLRDNRLPLTKRPTGFPGLDVVPDMWTQFSQLQWEYFPETLSKTQSIFGEERIIPFREREYLNSGGSGKLFKVTLAREYDGLGLAPGEFDHGADRQFALKTYSGRDAKSYFDTEVANFKKLYEPQSTYDEPDGHAPDGLISLYTAYQHGATYNVLLELANAGSLHDFLLREDPPTSGKAILAFWRALLETIKALASIHELEEDIRDEGKKVFQGLHQDIKLKNVLVLHERLDPDELTGEIPETFKFKLADLGLSHFVLATHGLNDMETDDKMGTQTYGAPEVFRRTEQEQRARYKITRSIDVWSLGCVFLVVAIWIVYGKKGVEAFDRARKAENDRNETNAGFCFHDGRRARPQVLRSVTARMNSIPHEVKKSDYITGAVIHNMIRQMIRAIPQQRTTASVLSADADELLSSAEKASDNYYTIVASSLGDRQPRLVTGSFASGDPMTALVTAANNARFGKLKAPLGAPFGPPLPVTNEHSRVPSVVDAPTGPPSGMLLDPPTPTQPPHSFVGPSTYHFPSSGNSRKGIETPAQASHGNVSMDEFRSSASATQQQLGTQQHNNARSSPKREMPRLSLHDAHQFIKDSTSKRKLFNRPSLPQEVYLKKLKEREHIFVIDNSQSMSEHVDNLEIVAKIMLFFTTNNRSIEVEVRCTNSADKKASKDWPELTELSKRLVARAVSQTDIKIQLGSILNEHKLKLQGPGGFRVPPLSIYVLTDSKWERWEGVDTMLKDMAQSLREVRRGKKHFGVQFVQFGNEREATARLKQLDRVGKNPFFGPDIVDTTHCQDNVLKMLLGAFDPMFDDDGEEVPDVGA